MEEINRLRQQQKEIGEEINKIKDDFLNTFAIKKGDTVRFAKYDYRVASIRLNDKLEVDKFGLDRIRKDGSIGRQTLCYSWNWKELEKL
jgi:hypothetical protein